MNSPFATKLPKCHSIDTYEAIDMSHTGILTYPASSCLTNPCMSWDIDSSVAYENPKFTFKIRGTSNLGNTYESDLISITIQANNDFSPELEPSDISTADGIFQIGDTRLFEIDQFSETLFGLEVINYILTTDLTSTSSALLSPGCSSFVNANVAGTLQSNGKIGFVIETTSLQSPCEVRVYAELALFSTIYKFT